MKFFYQIPLNILILFILSEKVYTLFKYKKYIIVKSIYLPHSKSKIRYGKNAYSF